MDFMHELLSDAKKTKKGAEARRLLAELLSESLLHADDVSENTKMAVRIMDEVTVLNRQICNEIDDYVAPGKNESHSVDTLKEIHEYLTLVKAGITQFFEEISKRGNSK